MEAFRQYLEADAVCGTIQYWFSWSDKATGGERGFNVNLGIKTARLFDPPELLIHNLKASGRKPGMGCVIVRREFAEKYPLFVDDFKYVSEDQLFWTKVSLHAVIYVLDKCLAKYRQHSLSSSSVLAETGKTSEDWKQFLNWLESYFEQNKVENQDVWDGLRSCQKENAYRKKYGGMLNLYHRMLPHFIRFRIRDLIIWWRMRK